MIPDHVTENIASWSNVTLVHPVGITVLILLSIWVMVAKRRWVPVAFLILACVAARQRIAVASLDFTFIRLLILVGWVRILITGELRQVRWRAVDAIVLVWAVVAMVTYLILQSQVSALIFMSGRMLDAAGAYILFRALIRRWDDLMLVARSAAVIALPLSAAFLIERSTGRNMFWVFGGVPQFTPIRQGELRCQGAFAHPILAGVFWATLLPMIAAIGFDRRKYRTLAVAGTVAALVIVVSTASSTPLAAVAATIVAAAFFPLRHFMRYIKWGIPLGVIALHLTMNNPVWHLIGRIDLVGGSTGYHRYRLIDAAVERLDEWWLFGTVSTAHWGRQLFDVTNQYVLEGVRGGMGRLLLFTAILVLAFNCVGRAVRRFDRGPRAIMAWAIGCALFASVASFMAVSYFGEIVMLWNLLLAVAAGADETSLRLTSRARQTARPGKTLVSAASPSHSQPRVAGAPA